MAKVFLSYSHKDQEFVEKLYRRLTKDGVECFFDKESMTWGANWVIELEQGIKDAQFVVVVYSPEYFKSEWGTLERISALIKDPTARKQLIRPLLLEPCGDLIPTFLQPIHYLDVSIPEKFEKNYSKICRNLGGTPLEESQTVNRTQLPPITRLPERNRMPYRSVGNAFVGRVDSLWEIDDILRNRKTAVVEGVGVVAGTGGLGKTQLAIEYVWRFGVNYPGGVFWIEAEHGIAIMIVQISQAAGIEIDNSLKEKVQLEHLWRQLGSFPPNLVVLDNFPEKGPIQPWLPSGSSIHTLVTTRRRDLSRYSRIPLDFLSPEEGIKLLNSGDRQFGTEAEALVEKLGGLPLALELARNFLNIRPTINIEDLMAEMDRIGEIRALDEFAEKYADELPSGHIKEVAATFLLSWDLASPSGQSLLRCMAYLSPVPVPRRLLARMLNFQPAKKNFIKKLFSRFRPRQKEVYGVSSDTSFEDPLGEAISDCAGRLYLLELDEDNDPWMHRLVCGFVKSTSGDDAELFESVLKSVEDEMARAADENDNRSFRELEKVLPHADYLLSSKRIQAEPAINISNYLHWHYNDWGKYRLAEKYGRMSLNIAAGKYEAGHPSIARSQSNLALVLKDLGDLEGARDLLEKALESAQQSFEAGHPSIAISQSNLALVLQDLGDLEEARDLIQSAYNTFLERFGEKHHHTIITKGNLESVMEEL